MRKRSSGQFAHAVHTWDMKTLIQIPEDEETQAIQQSLVGPACGSCGGITRLAGIEPHPKDDHTDLRTFECLVCGDVSTLDVPLRGTKA